jgi:hypothetical protein
VDEYDHKNQLVRIAARSQLGDEIDKLNQELDAFGARFTVKIEYFTSI